MRLAVNPSELKKKRKRPRLIESGIQKSFLEWLSLQFPRVREVTFSIPNGGARTPWYGARLKAEGLMPGVPDLFVAYPSGGSYGLFLEFKGVGQIATPLQMRMMDLLENQGYEVRIVFSAEDAILIVKSYLRE